MDRYVNTENRDKLNTALRTNLGSDQLKTFGPTVSGLIRNGIEPERVILYDTKVEGGRPDSIKLIKDAYQKFNAEGRYSQYEDVTLTRLLTC
jgi:hypothetical protein